MKKRSMETAIMSVIVSVAILTTVVWAGHWTTSYLVNHRQDMLSWVTTLQ